MLCGTWILTGAIITESIHTQKSVQCLNERFVRSRILFVGSFDFSLVLVRLLFEIMLLARSFRVVLLHIIYCVFRRLNFLFGFFVLCFSVYGLCISAYKYIAKCRLCMYVCAEIDPKTIISKARMWCGSVLELSHSCISFRFNKFIAYTLFFLKRFRFLFKSFEPMQKPLENDFRIVIEMCATNTNAHNRNIFQTCNFCPVSIYKWI